MTGRGLGLLALVAALAAGAAWYVRQPVPDAAPDAADNRFLPGLADRLPEVTAVRARTAGGELLARVVRDGDRWRVENRYGYPADPSTLRGTLIALSEARRVEAKTDRPEGWARLGLQPIANGDAGGVELTLEGLEPPLQVLIGEAAAGDASGTYVRRADEAGGRAWLVSGNIERPDEIGDWLDDRLVELRTGRLRSVEIRARDGDPVHVARVEPRSREFEIANRPADRRPLSNTVARSIARIVTDLRLTDVRPSSEVRLPERLAVARFRTLDGLALTIESFAEQRRSGKRYIRLRAGAADDAAEGVAEEVATLNARFDGWIYEIPDYKFVNVSQNLEGVLEEPR